MTKMINWAQDLSPEYVEYALGFKREVIRKLVPTIGENDALVIAKNGYLFQPAKHSRLYKLFLYPEAFSIIVAERDDDTIPSPRHAHLRVYDLCVGSDTGPYHKNRVHDSGFYCSGCRNRAICDFVAAYLLIRTDESRFYQTANRTRVGHMSFSKFNDTGFWLLPEHYSEIMP